MGSWGQVAKQVCALIESTAATTNTKPLDAQIVVWLATVVTIDGLVSCIGVPEVETTYLK